MLEFLHKFLMEYISLPEHIQKSIVGVRTITAKCLGRVLKGTNGKNLCRWCRGKLEGRRSSWCSDRCVQNFVSLRDCASTILDRDKGRCQTCNCDVLELEYILKSWKFKSEDEKQPFRDKYPDWFRSDGTLKYSKPYAIDHITPIWNKGTSTTDNLQILCAVHHRIKTSKEATDRAKRKRNGRA